MGNTSFDGSGIRKRLFDVIEPGTSQGKASLAYDYFMIVVIVLSLVPLAFKEPGTVLNGIDKVCVAIFIIDYLLRWVTADYKFGRQTAWSFLRYPFSPMAIIDLLSILPSLVILNQGFRALRALRLLRSLRAFRVFRVVRYSKSINILVRVIKDSKSSLLAVCALAIGYTLISALVIFSVEPDSFGNFFEALYWAVVSLTTVGYGDLYPVSVVGRVIAMVSSFFGIAIVALPAGIITAGYVTEISRYDETPGLKEGSVQSDCTIQED